jgi:hypothetical protein
MVADTVEAFAQVIQYCYLQRESLETFGRRARAFVERNFHSHHIAQQLLET